MKQITSIQIDTTDLSALSQSRNFRIIGESGCVFSIQVKTSGNKFYNFSAQKFGNANVYTPAHRLSNAKIRGRSYTGSINFPADADGETYTFIVHAEAHFETEFAESVIGGYLVSGELVGDTYNRFLYSTDIKQIADVTITIQPKGDDTSNFSSATNALTATATASPVSNDPQTIDFSFAIENAATDADGFGLQKIKDTLVDSDFFFIETETIDHPGRDASASFAEYGMDTVTNIGVGMEITAATAGSLSGTPIVTVAEKYPLTAEELPGVPYIRIQPAQTFSDNVTLTFRAYGSDSIKNSTGIDISFEDLKIEITTPSTTTVRGTVSNSTSVTVNGTYGFGKGLASSLRTYIEGFGVDNTTDNPITGVSASSSAGTITMTTNQTLVENTKLTAINVAKKYTITGKAIVKKFPSSNTVIYLGLSRLFRVGGAS